MKNSAVSKIFSSLKKARPVIHTCLWFLLGACIGLFFFASFVYIYFKHTYDNKVYPGVSVSSIELGGKTQDEVAAYFSKLNEPLQKKRIVFTANEKSATVSAKELEIGYDEKLLAKQAFSIGRSGNFFTDSYLSLTSYLKGIELSPAYHFSSKTLDPIIRDFEEAINIAPVDARFEFKDGRVTEFTTAKNGRRINPDDIVSYINEKAVPTLIQTDTLTLTVPIKVEVLKPDVTENEANKMGITERISVGTSLFFGSIENRIYNLTLASSRLNGVLVKPGEEFSFNKTIGDISSLTGYKQAYVIQNGKTILGDGGGVCQVSTTLFRALLNAGLPIIERNQHAYRVHYYEDDLGPGIDAAIYTPTIDLKFRNDTGNYILIQTSVDRANMKLTYELYGTSDGRVANISKPVIVSQSPAPEPVYQDDPTLPVGQVKQIDFAASGAVVYFTYKVTRDGEVLSDKKFNSNYRPWQAIFLRGTKPV
ncbi:MAG: VanW family protein [Candidatus Levybacteria bacterium]|nr:VanW family protein [Candidatus Levybacteria bacterium]